VGEIGRLRGRGLKHHDVAIFYRTNAQSRVIEEVLLESNIAYAVVGGVRFYDRAEVKDLLAYLRVIHNPADAVGLRRIINTPPRGIGKTTIDRAEDGRGARITLHDAFRAGGAPGPPRPPQKIEEIGGLPRCLRRRRRAAARSSSG
jgi:superfamily I DNA/RNA helicase